MKNALTRSPADHATDTTFDGDDDTVVNETADSTVSMFEGEIASNDYKQRSRSRRLPSLKFRNEADTPPTFFGEFEGSEIYAEWSPSQATNPELEVFRPHARAGAPESFVREWEYLQEMILREDFELGKVSATEELFEAIILKHPLEIRAALNRFYIRNFQNSKVLGQILHLISRVDSPELLDLFEIIAIASFVQSNDEVKELGVRCFEAWATPESIKTLEGVDTETEWLKKYIDAVVRDLRISYGIYR